MDKPKYIPTDGKTIEVELTELGFTSEWEEFYWDMEEDFSVLQVWTLEKKAFRVVYCGKFKQKFLFSRNRLAYENMEEILPESQQDILTLIRLFSK